MNKYLNFILALLVLNSVAFKIRNKQLVNTATSALDTSVQDIIRSGYALSPRQTSGTINCGTQQITNGWQVNTEQYWTRTGGESNIDEETTSTRYFNSGTFTAPISGLYYVSAFMRNEDYHMDITIGKSGIRKSVFGNDFATILGANKNNAWISNGVGIVLHLTTEDSITLWYESGQDSGCSLETSFYYTPLNVFLIFADTNLG